MTDKCCLKKNSAENYLTALKMLMWVNKNIIHVDAFNCILIIFIVNKQHFVKYILIVIH